MEKFPCSTFIGLLLNLTVLLCKNEESSQELIISPIIRSKHINSDNY